MSLRPALLVASLLTATAALAVPPGGLPPQASSRARGATDSNPDVIIEAIRLSEASAGSYLFGVVLGLNTTKEDRSTPDLAALASARPTLTVEGRSFALTPSTYERTVNTDIASSRSEGTRAALTLYDADGATVWSGATTFTRGALTGRWDGDYGDGTEPSSLSVTDAQLHPTADRRFTGLSFTLSGDSALDVVSGDLHIFEGGARVPTFESTLTADDLHTTRTFTAPAAFDGNPLHSTYELGATITDAGGRTGTTTGTIEVIRVPGEGSAPGLMLGVYQGGFGNGYIPPSAQGQTQQTQLL